MSLYNKEEIYKKWKSLVNMTKSELEKFYNSDEGKEAGLSSSEAKSLGIHNGRQSARWIMKMKDTPHDKWTPQMWEWANRQISFISRMKGGKGELYDDNGNKTRRHTSLLIWGHNPEKFEGGGILKTGSTTNLGIIEDETETQYKINGDWYAKSLVKAIKKEEADKPLYVYENAVAKLRKEYGSGFIKLYHGTDKESYDKIISSKTIGDGRGITFFTSSLREAREYAHNKSKYRGVVLGGKVLEVSVPKWAVHKNKATGEYETEFILKENEAGAFTPTMRSVYDVYKNQYGSGGKVGGQYLYHGTGEGAFRKIREEGLIPQGGKPLYFADKEQYAKTYAERKGNSFGNRILRIKKSDIFIPDENTGLKGDYKMKAAIPPQDIELKYKNEWIPIQQYSDESIGIMPVKFGDGGALAPNGKTSNLNSEQWHLVRSEEFKLWFGDFEKTGYYNKLLDSDYTFNVEHKYPYDYFSMSHKERNKHYNDIVKESKSKANSAITKDGFKISITNRGLLHGIRHSMMDVILNSCFFLKDIIENSILFDIENNADIEDTSTVSFYCFFSIVKFLDNDYLFRITTALRADARMELYDYNVVEIKKHLVNTLNPQQGNTNHQAHHKDRKFFELTNTLTKNISKVVDSNGEPLVCYRGIVENPKDIEVKNPYYIKGLWFTSASSDENNYEDGNAEYVAREFSDIGEIECVFLNIKNPKIYDDYEDILDEIDRKGGIDNFYNSFIKRDGFKLEGSMTDGDVFRDDWVVFNPKQIKLANGSCSDIKYEVGGLIANNGKTSNLTPEQYKLVSTPEFKAWFGDFENDPKNSSKVVDSNGEPLVCYHSSDNKFNEFKADKIKKDGFHGEGFYFSTEDLEYGKNVYPCFLNFKNPFDINAYYDVDEIKAILGYKYRDIEPAIISELEYSIDNKVGGFVFYSFATNDLLKKRGYDGIIHHNIRVAFEPTQIKLADGTNKTFNSSDADIRYAKGGNLNMILIRGEGKQSEYTSSTDLFGSGLYLTDDMDVAKFYGDNIKEYSVKGKIFDTTKNFTSNELKKFLISLDNVLYTNEGRKYLQEIIEYNGGRLPKDTDIDYVGISWALNSKYEFMKLLEDKNMANNNFNSYADVCSAMNLALIKMGYVGLKYSSNEVDDLSDNNIKDRNLYLIFDDNAIEKTDDNVFENGGLIAPNGKPSNLTEEQYKLVRTASFKKWFGDFENDPDNASKVVDENGEPLVVWHGAEQKWWENIEHFVFNPQLEGKSTNVVRRKFGSIYFTSNKEVANTFGGKNGYAVGVFLNFRTPIIIEANYLRIDLVSELDDVRYNEDVIIKNTEDSMCDLLIYSDIYITTKIFGAIKLADGTNTTFDTNNPDIRYEVGGEINEEAQTYIDILSTNSLSGNYQKYKDILKDKFGIDFDSLNKDQEYIDNASLNDIKKQDDFLNFDNWLIYAKKVSKMRGFVNMDLYDTPNDIMTDSIWNEMAKKLDFEVEKVPYEEHNTGSGDIARTMADRVYYTEHADLYYFLHELGHVYDFQNKLEANRIVKNPAYSPTHYGTTNAGEDFAENFAIYFINPTALKNWNKDVYEEMDAVINDKYKKEVNKLLKDNNAIKYVDGGAVSEDLECNNCGEIFKISGNEDYLCPKCHYDNETAYIMKALKPTKTLEEISLIHDVPVAELQQQLDKGTEEEKSEHTNNNVTIAKIIALHHIEEDPYYYIPKGEVSDVEDAQFIHDAPDDIMKEPFVLWTIKDGNYTGWFFHDLESAALFAEKEGILTKDTPFFIRDRNTGKTLLDKEQIKKIIDKKFDFTSVNFEYGGVMQDIVNVKDYIAQQIQFCEDLLFSDRSKLHKVTTCMNNIDTAKHNEDVAEDGNDKNIYYEAGKLWKATLVKVKDSFCKHGKVEFADGGVADCGCGSNMKFSKGGGV